MGLATPTEAGAMGAVGAFVLAAIHRKDFSIDRPHLHDRRYRRRWHRRHRRHALQRQIRNFFKLTFAVAYFAVVWVCLEAFRIPDLRDLIKQAYETTMRLTAMVVFILIGSPCSRWCSRAWTAASGSSTC